MLAGKRASSAMGSKFKLIPGAWIPAIPAGMTIFEKGIRESDKVELTHIRDFFFSKLLIHGYRRFFSRKSPLKSMVFFLSSP